jgi:FAM91 N-terminus
VAADWPLNAGMQCNPPMQAADIVHVVGIERNEYINLMNQCKARKLVSHLRVAPFARLVMRTSGGTAEDQHGCHPAPGGVPSAQVWRVNKAIAREVLPSEPLDPRLEPWWIAHVVNLGDRCTLPLRTRLQHKAAPCRMSAFRRCSATIAHWLLAWAAGRASMHPVSLPESAGRRGGVPVTHARGAEHLPRHCGGRRAAGVRPPLQVPGHSHTLQWLLIC